MIRTLTPIFSIVIALVVFFFYAKPIFSEIKDIQGETSQYREAAEKAVEMNRTLEALIDKKRSYTAENLERLDAFVPSELNEVKILTDLNQIARSHSMLFGNVKVSSNEATTRPEGSESGAAQSIAYTDFVTTNIDFALIGSYEQFKAFLADVEESMVLLETISIDFEAGEGELQQYGMSVQIFSLPPIQ